MGDSFFNFAFSSANCFAIPIRSTSAFSIDGVTSPSHSTDFVPFGVVTVCRHRNLGGADIEVSGLGITSIGRFTCYPKLVRVVVAVRTVTRRYTTILRRTSRTSALSSRGNTLQVCLPSSRGVYIGAATISATSAGTTDKVSSWATRTTQVVALLVFQSHVISSAEAGPDSQLHIIPPRRVELFKNFVCYIAALALRDL